MFATPDHAHTSGLSWQPQLLGASSIWKQLAQCSCSALLVLAALLFHICQLLRYLLQVTTQHTISDKANLQAACAGMLYQLQIAVDAERARLMPTAMQKAYVCYVLIDLFATTHVQVLLQGSIRVGSA
jgi:hypothetical protein